MAKKRKTLPKTFEALIEAKDIKSLKKMFDTCEVDARGGYGKSTALSTYFIPNELVRWLVEKGADIDAVDIYGCTALHRHASFHSGDISILLELGANVNAKNNNGETPLHYAAGGGFKVDDVKRLIENGAKTEIVNKNGQTPFDYALKRANNINLIELVEVSKVFLKINSEVTQVMKDSIHRLGENFEFHRENFNKESLAETDEALSALYEMFNVIPIKKRIMHDGVSTICVQDSTWEKQYEELWDFLIPSSGSAKTIQGEVVRISGKVRDEIYRNGGGNWNTDFKKMLDAFFSYLSLNNSLNNEDLEKIGFLIKDIRKNGDAETEELNYLCELATKWVLLNPNPIILDKPNYKR
ncbi:ankyrin repeat domain-containing protein [Cellulophaga sp. HaHaR_3_176]|uniref:ankyrin repeat domain-containing protein n=1 Tax=Cellulophaga sp. HaHaR_3_176 TaxID=1942464 RepID=UPI001C1FD511|nr:ankyrin repeat domain-containing protein [Cellulophaga sp. HaHaR_3_176]QWX82523.1 ankyrin repeat domain-containing protein [Cellulophaga sp. HaHaR_3_176]